MIETTNSLTQGLSQLYDYGKQNLEDEFIFLIPKKYYSMTKGLKGGIIIIIIFFNNVFKWIMYTLIS